MVVKKPNLGLLTFVLAVFAFLIPILYQDRFMTFGLLRAYSIYFDLLPTPFVVVQKIYDPANLLAIFHSIFAGGSMVLTYKLLRKEQK